MSRCVACNRKCDDEELKQDMKGWVRFEPMCKKCLVSIQEDEYDFPALDSEFKGLDDE